jgi:hypothetical protein
MSTAKPRQRLTEETNTAQAEFRMQATVQVILLALKLKEFN